MGLGRGGAAAAAALAVALSVLVPAVGAPAAGASSRHAGGTRRGPDAARWVTPPLTAQGRSGGAAAQGTVGTTEQTFNWSGEMSTGSAFSAVSAEWTVPAVTASASSRDSATWVGVGGSSRSATGLIQTGTDQHTATGRTGYSAWYEVLPTLAVTIVDPASGHLEPVAPGDLISAEVARQTSGLWLIQIADLTEAWTSRTTSAYTGTTLSAEWVEEAPTLGGSVETLADFSSVRFTHMKAAASGATTLVAVQMVDRAGNVIAFPGAVQPSTTRSVTVRFGSSTSAGTTPGSTTPPATPPATPGSTGYDLVGADGGVFVFDPPGTSGGFYGSLPGIHVVPAAPIVGMVATADDKGYYLVGADGGVFAFGDAPFLGSLPGLGVVPRQPITGMVAAPTDRGYFLVGRDGGVFSFGSVPFLGSLPAEGISVHDVVGIAATPGGSGYWLVAATGEVYAFGAARHFETATQAPVRAIAGTATGGGYWVVTATGAVDSFGNARDYGTLPAMGISPARPVVGMARTADTGGYWLIGADGGVFAFGDAPFVGALPSIARVRDVVGAVATAA